MEIQYDRFVSREMEAAYDKLKIKSGITVSKTLDQSKFTHQISQLFNHTTLLFSLELQQPFYSEFLFEFYANIIINSEKTQILSRVFGRDIVITKEDFTSYLFASSEGASVHSLSSDPRFDWTEVNLVLRNSNLHFHLPKVSELVKDARVIQHILRKSIIPKAGDRTNITPLLSLTTFYILTHTPFDVADLFIRYIDNVAQVMTPRFKKKTNIALGHILFFMIQSKYNLENPYIPDVPVQFFSDAAFQSTLGGKKRKPTPAVEEEEEEEEEEAEEGRAPHMERGESSTTAPRRSLEERVAALEATLQAHIHEQRAEWTEQRSSWAWLKAKFDCFRPSTDE